MTHGRLSLCTETLTVQTRLINHKRTEEATKLMFTIDLIMRYTQPMSVVTLNFFMQLIERRIQFIHVIGLARLKWRMMGRKD